MLASIAGARERVHLETYILRSDEVGSAFLDELCARARAGVEVRLLYDALGSRGIDPGRLSELRDAGGDVVAFNPFRRSPRRFALRSRDHRKILVVDGRTGFTGGLNIGDEYAAGITGTAEPEWRDAHVRIEGPAVRHLEAVFLESWFRANGPGLPWDALLGGEPPRNGEVRCAVLADGPVYRRRRMREVIVSALEEAEREVLLTSPYFAPGRRVFDALAATSHAGVHVEILLAGQTDHPILRRGARAILPKLLAAGLRCYEYEQSMLHAKVAVFDGAWAILGTSNLDRQSFEHNFEVNVLIEGGDVPERLRQRFENDRAGARAVDVDTLAARGPIERLIDRLAALLISGL